MRSFLKEKMFFIVLIFLSVLSCTRSIDQEKRECVDSLLSKGRIALFEDQSLAKRLLLKAMKEARDSIQYYDAYEAYTTLPFIENKYDSGVVLKKGLLIALERQERSQRRQELIASVNNSIGVYYGQMNKPDSAILFLKRALDCPPARESMPDLYINLTDQYKAKGNLSMAAYYLKQALSLSDSLNLDQLKFPIYYGLGDIYLGLRDFEQANKFYLLAEKDYNNRRFDEQVLFCNNRGNYYYYKKEYQKALSWFKKADHQLKPTDYVFFKNLVWANLSDIYLNLNQLDSCRFYLNRSEPYFKNIDHKSILYYLKTIKIGLAISENDNGVVERLMRTTDCTQGVEPNISMIRYGYLKDFYLRTKRYKEAYDCLDKMVFINDSLRDDITQKRIAELAMSYRQDSTIMKKNLLIDQQRLRVSELRLNKYTWILICILVSVTACFGYYIVRKRNKFLRLKYLDQINRFRINNVRNRVSPHFAFNVLDFEMQHLNDVQKSRFYTLVHLLRRSLDLTDRNSVKLDEEIDFVNDYVQLSKHKMGEDFFLIWNISSEVKIDKITIIPMMIQMPVENAMKHGLALVKGEKRIVIDISHQDKSIRIFIRDNGIGYYPNKQKSPNSIGNGVKILSQTIQILNENNVSKISFTIHNIERINESGTEVEYLIPDVYNFTI